MGTSEDAYLGLQQWKKTRNAMLSSFPFFKSMLSFPPQTIFNILLTLSYR